MQFHFFHKLHRRILQSSGILMAGVLFFAAPLTAHAGIKEDNMAANQAVPVESNQIEGWPQGPIVSARSAILIELETGTILYAKNIHNQEYPASTTKILTTLIASEMCEMDEIVTFSHDAIYDTPYDSNHIALDVGESITVEQCLNAILIRSANEVSFGVAEHITGTCWEDFGEIMNERAKELGALNSNFVNPNGLPDENHYTTAYDMAMIGRAFFSNEILCNMTTTRMLRIPATDTQPDDIVEVNQMELIKGGDYEYEYLVGCKTGYTNAARSSLVSCAEKDGLKLICVVMRDEAPYQYEDTLALFEYGFSNFQKLNISENDTKYNMDSNSLFYSENDILGNSRPILSLNTSDFIVIPNTADFADTVSSISYETQSETQAALINYTYQGICVGSASIDFTGTMDKSYEFDLEESVGDEEGVDADIESDGENIGTGTEGVGAESSDGQNEETGKNTESSGNKASEKSGLAAFFQKVGKTILVILLGIIALAVILLLLLFIRRYLIIRKRRKRRRGNTALRPSSDPYSTVNSNRRRSQAADARRRQRAADARRRQSLKRSRRWR